jgi:hypothetical protein
LKLKISAHQKDMTAVIRTKINQKITQGVIISPEFANEIVEVLLQRAQGM